MSRPSLFWLEARAYALQGLWTLRSIPAIGAAAPAQPLTVFVHGYLGTPGVFGALSRALAERGVATRQLHFTYGITGTIASLAQRLGDRIRAEQPEGPVHIVGHSMGGLVARYYRQLLRGRVDRLALLATPHHGTRRARFYGALPLAREIAPGSATLRALAATADALDGVATCCVLAEGDTMITPVESAALDGHEVFRVPDVGHQSMLMDARVIERVALLLNVEASSAPRLDSRHDAAKR